MSKWFILFLMYFSSNHQERYFQKLFVRRWQLFHQHRFIAHYWSTIKSCHLIHSIYRKNLDSVIYFTNNPFSFFFFFFFFCMYCCLCLKKFEKCPYMFTPSQNSNFYAVVMDVVILVTDSLENALTKNFLLGYLTKDYIFLCLI